MALFNGLTSLSLRKRLRGVLPEEGLLRWWLDGFVVCLPASLRRRLAVSRDRLIVEPVGKLASVWIESEDGRKEIGKLDLEVPNPSDFSSVSAGRAVSVVLQLPAQMILKKRLSLPASVEENLRQVLGFEMDRLTPFESNQVFYDFRILKRDSQKMDLELVLSKRDDVQPWMQALNSIQLPPSVVSPEDGWPKANLLPLDERGGNGGVKSRITPLLWMLLVLLSASIVISPLLQKQRWVESLDSDLAKVRREAVQISDLREELDRTLESARYVIDKRLQTRSVVDVLREVTRLLPDDTWVQQLELKRGKLQLRGESAQALGLIERLETTPFFKEVVFLSPVVQVAGKGYERFNISAMVNPMQSEDPSSE